jgi:hypothetical protein
MEEFARGAAAADEGSAIETTTGSAENSDLRSQGGQALDGYDATRPRAKQPEGTDSATFYNVNSNGLRNEDPLTSQQIQEVVEYAEKLGVPAELIYVSEHLNTSWGELFGTERLNIGTDVLPSTEPRIAERSANSRVSGRGAIGHEVVGHRRAAQAGRTQEQLVLEEAQASIRAARFAPDLTVIERLTLIRDGVERLHKSRIRVSDVRDLLWIEEP